MCCLHRETGVVSRTSMKYSTNSTGHGGGVTFFGEMFKESPRDPAQLGLR